MRLNDISTEDQITLRSHPVLNGDRVGAICPNARSVHPLEGYENRPSISPVSLCCRPSSESPTILSRHSGSPGLVVGRVESRFFVSSDRSFTNGFGKGFQVAEIVREIGISDSLPNFVC